MIPQLFIAETNLNYCLIILATAEKVTITISVMEVYIENPNHNPRMDPQNIMKESKLNEAMRTITVEGREENNRIMNVGSRTGYPYSPVMLP